MATTEPAPATVSASDPMRPEPFVVRHVLKETGDTFTRDRRGQVNGLEMFAGRVLHLRFDKVVPARR